MSQPIFSNDAGGLRIPAANSSAILVVALLWLAFACALPLYQLREARRQARQDLLRMVALQKPDAGGLATVFDRSNQNLDAAASGPCLILAFTSILLVNQMLKLKRRYNALAHDRSTPEGQQGDAE